MRTMWVGAAGFVGAIARYWVDGLVARRASVFPWGTFVVNVSGCFVLGLLVTVFADRFVAHSRVRAALTVGLLGAYTTFSTFSLETVRLVQDGALVMALVNVAASVGFGIAAVYLGFAVARAI